MFIDEAAVIFSFGGSQAFDGKSSEIEYAKCPDKSGEVDEEALVGNEELFDVFQG
jgi:hypothetical protein